jgi:hypothetical protein
MPEPIMIRSSSMIGIVHVVVIDWSQAHQEDGTADERPRPLDSAENLLGTQ